MDIFNIIVGIFSILSSIATIVSVGLLIFIKNHISIKGDNNATQTINQSNHGNNNSNIN